MEFDKLIASPNMMPKRREGAIRYLAAFACSLFLPFVFCRLRKKAMGMGGLTVSSDDIVIKSPNDRRLYRLLELENGLRALLVHDLEIYPEEPPKVVQSDDEKDEEEEEEEEDDEGDEDGSEEGDEDGKGDCNEVGGKGIEAATQTKKAAATMCVGIGSFSDPFEAQGLAHFLEHMLFMGSDEFPDENEGQILLGIMGSAAPSSTTNATPSPREPPS